MQKNESDHKEVEERPFDEGGAVARTSVTATPAFLYGFVLVMGAIGATLRYLLELAFPVELTGGFPFGTLVINLVGCYIIYIVYQWLDRRARIPHAVARGIGVGFAGALTTLSAFCLESLEMLQTGEYLLFAIYIIATFFGTFLASLAGWATCSLLAFRRFNQLQKRRIERRSKMQSVGLHEDETPDRSEHSSDGDESSRRQP